MVEDRNDHAPGFKMTDAELLGFSFILILGNVFMKEGNVEIKVRATGKTYYVPISEVPQQLQTLK